MLKSEFLKRIEKLKPELLSEYCLDLLPERFKYNEKINIKCKIHGSVKVIPNWFANRLVCPKCGINQGRKNRTKTTEEFIEISKKKFGNYLDYSETIYTANRDDKIKFICPIHGLFMTTSKAHLGSRNACDKCGKHKKYIEMTRRLLELSVIVHNGFYDYSKVEIVSGRYKVTVICPEHGEYRVKLSSHSRGGKCPQCSIENDRLSQDEFINKAVAKHGNKYDYSRSIYYTGRSNIDVICPEHGKFTQRASSHLDGVGCMECSLMNSKNTKEQFIKNSIAVHGDLYNYDKVLYVNNKSKVEIICKKHGSFWVRPDGHISSRNGCPKCLNSKGEANISTILNKYNICFIEQYKLDPYKFRYDFFLPEANILIEYNGIQHYEAVKTFGGINGYLRCVGRDNFKRFIAHWNRKDLIIIPYTFDTLEQIEEILIRLLKRKRFYWCIVDDKVTSFKGPGSAYDFFGIDSRVLLKDFSEEVQKKYPNVKTLF